MVRVYSNVSIWDLVADLSNCLPAIPAISNTQNRHQMDVLLSRNPDATKVADMPLKFSQKVYWSPLVSSTQKVQHMFWAMWPASAGF